MKAQKVLNEWDYNDSTEYILIPSTKIDTMAIETEVEKYRADLKIKIDSINARKEIANTIYQYSGKKLPEDLQEAYSDMYYEMKAKLIDVRNKYSSSDYYSGETINYDKAEKSLTKGKVDSNVAAAIPWYRRVCLDNTISSLQRISEQETFTLYKKIHNYNQYTVKYPMVEYMAKEENPNYRPKLFMKSRDEDSGGFRVISGLEYIDDRILMRGWEWINEDKDDGREHGESYPASYIYFVYPSHPEYRICWQFSQKVVFDKNGNLIRIFTFSRDYWGQCYEIVKDLVFYDCRADYEANTYGVRSENKMVQYFIKYQLGYLSDAEIRNGEAYLNAYPNEANKAYNYVKQLEQNHEFDYKYLYKIERISGTSFIFHFVNYDMSPKCDVYISYHTSTPGHCERKIDKIVRF